MTQEQTDRHIVIFAIILTKMQMCCLREISFLMIFEACLLFSQLVNKIEFTEPEKTTIWMVGRVVGVCNLKMMLMLKVMLMIVMTDLPVKARTTPLAHSVFIKSIK